MHEWGRYCILQDSEYVDVSRKCALTYTFLRKKYNPLMLLILSYLLIYQFNDGFNDNPDVKRAVFDLIHVLCHQINRHRIRPKIDG